MRLTALALVNFSSHFLISSGETLLLDKSIYPVKLLDISLKVRLENIVFLLSMKFERLWETTGL